MFEAWGRALYTRRRLTLGIALALVAFAAVWGTGVFGKLSAGNSFTPPASQSQREADQASQVFGRNDADVVVLYRSATRTVGDPAYRQAVTASLNRLPRAEVARVSTYWSTGSPRLVSAGRHATYAVLQLAGADDAARQDSYKAIKAELTPASLASSGVTARVGGTVPMEAAINSEVTANIAKAELFREELHRQPTVEQAVARTVATAGRTVAVSGITVALALTSLMLFPEDFLRSMGFGGVATVAVDLLAALTVLPALLAVLGPKVNALRIRRSLPPVKGHRPVRTRPAGPGTGWRTASCAGPPSTPR
jgi:RND superfamily putative drug exporter